MNLLYFLLLLVIFTHESLATTCKVNGTSVQIGTGATTNIYVNMNNTINTGTSINLVDLSQQVTCIFDRDTSSDVSRTDYMTFKTASTLGTAFTGSGISGWVIAAGTRSILPVSGQNTRVTTLPNNLTYYPLNLTFGLSFPSRYNSQVNIRTNDLIATFVLQQNNNYDSSGGALTINLRSSSDVTINVRGCEVSTGDLSQTVRLPPTPLGSNRTAPRKLSSGATDFSIGLNCDAGTKVLLTPSGTVGSNPQPGVYANQSTGTNAANNMGIAVDCQKKGGDYQPLINNTVMTIIDAADETENIPCRASYYSYGNATTGNITSSLTLAVTYQ